jgi:hypothetical protein
LKKARRPRSCAPSGLRAPAVERADEHGRAAGGEEEIVDDERPFPDTGAKIPPWRSIGARQAKSASEPPIKKTRIARMKTPRVGSTAKEWTEVRTPERTRKVPSRDSEKVRIASRIVQTFSASRFSITTVE